MTSVLQLQDKILKDAADGNDCSVILTDMSAAIDAISHEVLLGKLKLYGVTEQALGWFASYFSNRAQQCEIGGARSSIIRILHGVFQGSILGPLLFICFMNDVVVLGTLIVLFILYADDTTIVVKLTGNLLEDQGLVDQKMEEISTYMNANSLAFNFKKTNLINVSVRKREDPGVVLNFSRLSPAAYCCWFQRILEV